MLPRLPSRQCLTVFFAKYFAKIKVGIKKVTTEQQELVSTKPRLLIVRPIKLEFALSNQCYVNKLAN
jgi:hypothetical protein